MHLTENMQLFSLSQHFFRILLYGSVLYYYLSLADLSYTTHRFISEYRSVLLYVTANVLILCLQFCLFFYRNFLYLLALNYRYVVQLILKSVGNCTALDFRNIIRHVKNRLWIGILIYIAI